MHLKQIHQLGQFPRSVSIPPMNDAHMLDYMQHHEGGSSGSSSGQPSQPSSSKLSYSNGKSANPNGMFAPNGFGGNRATGGYDDDSDPAKASPFAALGLNEESYHMIIGDMMGQEGTGFFGGEVMDGRKRGVDEDGEDGGGKRPRFEEIVD